MTLSIHPEAVDNFNKKAEDILALLSEATQQRREPSFPSQVFVSPTIKLSDIIGEMKHSEVDFKGNEVSRYFNHEGKLIGLSGDSYIDFERLCIAIQMSTALRNTISLMSTKDGVFEWLKLRYKNQMDQLLVEFILPLFESLIRKIEIWIPIFGTEIETSFSVGNVTFKPIGKTFIDKWFNESIKGRPDEEVTKLTKFFENERREIQGLAVGSMSFNADPERANEIAITEIERMLNLVRFFEPVNFHPELSSHCTILGKQNLHTTKLYHVENGTIIGTIESIVDKGSKHWRIDKNLLAKMREEGLDKLNSFLTSDKLTKFQILVLDALQIYSRAGLAKTYSDKLLYLIVALETLLLKDNSESVQQNVGERLAFALEKDANKRKQIVKNFKDVYSMRSDFVHRGNDVEIEQVNALSEFMRNTWRFLNLVIHKSNDFKTKLEMIDAIEHIKFS